jgi:hypothetical protein
MIDYTAVHYLFQKVDLNVESIKNIELKKLTRLLVSKIKECLVENCLDFDLHYYSPIGCINDDDEEREFWIEFIGKNHNGRLWFCTDLDLDMCCGYVWYLDEYTGTSKRTLRSDSGYIINDCVEDTELKEYIKQFFNKSAVL